MYTSLSILRYFRPSATLGVPLTVLLLAAFGGTGTRGRITFSEPFSVLMISSNGLALRTPNSRASTATTGDENRRLGSDFLKSNYREVEGILE